MAGKGKSKTKAQPSVWGIPVSNGAISPEQLAQLLNASADYKLAGSQATAGYNNYIADLAERFATGVGKDVTLNGGVGTEYAAAQAKAKQNMEDLLSSFSRGMRGYTAQGIRQRQYKQQGLQNQASLDQMIAEYTRAKDKALFQKNQALDKVGQSQKNLVTTAYGIGGNAGKNLFYKYSKAK